MGMRILSQSGMTDLPYENIGVSINAHDNQEIIAYPLNGGEDDFWEMARYSTEEKAKKAMEMLRDAYMVHNQYNSMTAEQKSLFIASASEKQQQILYGVFQFPADEEIEV